MRLEALKSFTYLVRAGSYPAASEELFLSPTTIHGHVKSLEEELQATLVHFNGRKLELSRAGSRFLIFAERMLEERARMEADIQGLARADAARLRVSSLHGPSVHLLPPVIAAFKKEHPSVLVTVTANGVGECTAALVSGQCDVTIMNEMHIDELPGGFTVTPLVEDSLEMIVRADCYEGPDVELLQKYPVALQPSASNYRQLVEKWARKEGISINCAYEHSSFDGILSFVMRGRCVGMVGGYIPNFSLATGVLRKLELPNFEFIRRVSAYHSVRMDPLCAEFIRFFQSYYEGRGGLVPSGSSNGRPGNL